MEYAAEQKVKEEKQNEKEARVCMVKQTKRRDMLNTQRGKARRTEK